MPEAVCEILHSIFVENLIQNTNNLKEYLLEKHNKQTSYQQIKIISAL